MDDAWLGSIDIVLKKAKTASYFDMPTSAIGDLSQPGGALDNVKHSKDGLTLSRAVSPSRTLPTSCPPADRAHVDGHLGYVLELITFAKVNGAVVLRFKHFGPEVEAWERDEANTYTLVGLANSCAQFR